jgi:hypothetical protein
MQQCQPGGHQTMDAHHHSQASHPGFVFQRSPFNFQLHEFRISGFLCIVTAETDRCDFVSIESGNFLPPVHPVEKSGFDLIIRIVANTIDPIDIRTHHKSPR